MHANDVEEGLAVDVEAGTRASPLGWPGDAVRILGLLAKRRGGDQSRSRFGQDGGLEIGLAAHDRRQGGSEVSARVAVIRQAHGHEQCAQVGITEA